MLPIAGWLIQDRYKYDTDTEEILEPTSPLDSAIGRDRRVIPGICVGGWDWTVDAIDLEGTEKIWKVLAPGDPEPSEEEWAAEITRRQPGGASGD